MERHNKEEYEEPEAYRGIVDPNVTNDEVQFVLTKYGILPVAAALLAIGFIVSGPMVRTSGATRSVNIEQQDRMSEIEAIISIEGESKGEGTLKGDAGDEN